jgi:ribonuclease P protein component
VSAKPASLGPHERLRRKSEFETVFEQGRRSSGRFMTVLLRPNRLESPRLGVVASRKLGGAVQRNRAKRLIRDLFRRHKPDLGPEGQDVVVIPRPELLDAAFANLEADYASVLRRHFRRFR